MQEQRATPRFRVEFNVRWETLKTQGRGAVSDLGAGGCFVLSSGDVTAGELARLQITSADEVVIAWGHVIYAVSEMGFAVRFVFERVQDRDPLIKLIRELPKL